jgi:hypothetical protein
MMVDSGADANVVGEADWEHLSKQYNQGSAVLYDVTENPRIRLKAYGTEKPLRVVASFQAWTQATESKPQVFVEFLVVKGGKRSLLGRKSAKAMKLLEIGLNVNAVEEIRLDEFPSVPDIEIKFTIDKSVTPRRNPYVNIPAHLLEQTIERLGKMERSGVIERFEGYSEWLSPMNVVPKANGDFRIVVNMGEPNKAIKRQFHHIPRLEEMTTKLCGAKRFTSLDISNAFHHFKLSKESSEMTAFAAPGGNFRFKRLVFGVNCAPELFQRHMEDILSGMRNTVVYIDDILLYANSSEELWEITAAVLERLKANNLTLNKEKCVFDVESVKFLGHKISEKGINIDEVKIQSIKSFRRPQNKTELKSFLGLANYVRKFIRNFADMTRTLYNLIASEGFDWTRQHEEAFQGLKAAIVECTVTHGFYDLNQKTELYTDASPVALGAVLTQVDGNGVTRTIAFASKLLTKVEQSYSQTHREALAIVWACEQFHYYLLGKRFTIKTDAEGVKFIYERTIQKPKRILSRAEGWALRLAAFDFDIVYVKGRDNIADASSRLYTSEIEPQQYAESEACAEIRSCEIMEYSACEIRAESKFVSIEEIKRETTACEEIAEVLGFLEGNKWEKNNAFYQTRERLDFAKGLLIRDDKIVIPKSLRSKVTEAGHVGHFGITKTIATIRERLWWPSMNKTIENSIKSCMTCVLNGTKTPPAPMTRTKLPEGAMDLLAVDHWGPAMMFGGVWVVALIDYYSRYVWGKIVDSTSWAALEPFYEEVFNRFGYPKAIKSDNGTTFTSEAYKEYCTLHDIEIVNSWPLNPQQNGAAEATMKNIGRAAKIASAEGKKLIETLRERIWAHNRAPHTETNEPPNRLMFKRHLQLGLPKIDDVHEAVNEYVVRERDECAKEKGRQYADNRRRARTPSIEEGDTVILLQEKPRKGATTYNPAQLKVISRRGGDLQLQTEDGVVVRRDVTRAKKVPHRDESKVDHEQSTATEESFASKRSSTEEEISDEIVNNENVDDENPKMDAQTAETEAMRQPTPAKDAQQDEQPSKRRRMLNPKYFNQDLVNTTKAKKRGEH